MNKESTIQKAHTIKRLLGTDGAILSLVIWLTIGRIQVFVNPACTVHRVILFLHTGAYIENFLKIKNVKGYILQGHGPPNCHAYWVAGNKKMMTYDDNLQSTYTWLNYILTLIHYKVNK